MYSVVLEKTYFYNSFNILEKYYIVGFEKKKTHKHIWKDYFIIAFKRTAFHTYSKRILKITVFLK